MFGDTVIASSHLLSDKAFGNKLRGESSKKHVKIWHVHDHMVRRCYDSTNKGYVNYGKRGITVCDEWLGEDGKFNFLIWSIRNGWRPDLFIDRIDNNAGYSPSNCRYATRAVNSRNSRATKLKDKDVLSIRSRYNSSQLGKFDFCKEVAKEFNVCTNSIRNVINNSTWN